MKRFTVFVALIVILLAGGGLTALLISSGGSVLPLLHQVNAPDASPMVMLPWKANQFFILIAVVLFNLIGIAVTIGIVLWVLDWAIRHSKADAQSDEKSAKPAKQS